MGQIAVIVFANTNTHWTARVLNPNVNHCFLCVMDRGRWVVIERSYIGVELYVLDRLPDGVYYQEVTITKPLPCLFPTCVGIVKSMTGVFNPFIITPFQLLKYMRTHHGKQTQKTESYSSGGGAQYSPRGGALAGNSDKREAI